MAETQAGGERRGVFVVLEGIEGSGKTTQAGLLTEWLAAAGVACVRTREPGGTALGEEIRRLLLDSGHVPPRAELLLMLAARAALLDAVVGPALAAGQVVVADRFDLSTLAYQAYGRGLPLADVERLNSFATTGVRPDITILLDVPQAAGEARRAVRGRADRIEREARVFHERVGAAYRLLGEQDGIAVVDGTRDIAGVQRRIRELLTARFPETFPGAVG
jgi:dTMP kinase